MKTDERFMFHLTSGTLRRFSLWNENNFPEWADPGEQEKWYLFQSWRREPYKVIGIDPKTGQQQLKYHPMSEFDNWSLWLIIDLIRYLKMPSSTYAFFEEPEDLKQAIVDCCEDMYSNYEQQSSSQLVR